MSSEYWPNIERGATLKPDNSLNLAAASAAAPQAGGDAGATCGLRVRSRGRLPHWEQDRGTYFITFRLADSLPRHVLESLRLEREAILLKASVSSMRSSEKRSSERSTEEGADARIVSSRSQREREKALFSRRIETYLDSGHGACHMSNPEIARLVADAIRIFDGERYNLWAWCVMPNHVHVVVELLSGQSLAATVHSWKSFTARKAKELLGISGSFWQREYYDHLIRNEDDLHRAIQYAVDNPEKSGLQNWQWVWVRK